MTGEQKPLEFLVIDDEYSITLLLERYLELAGANTTIAVDGQEGIDKYVQMHEAGIPYDVVFTDYSMPRATAVDVAKAVKERHPKTLVYVLTADVTLPDEMKEVSGKFKAQLGELKPDGFIPKPFVRDKMVSFIGQIKLYKEGTIENIPAYQPPIHQS